MKTSIKLIALLTVIFLLTSCVKDQSTVEGKITYINLIGLSNTAKQAEVILVNDLYDYYQYETTTDSEGYYYYEDVIDGKYYIYAEIEVNGFLYNGTSPSFWVEGDESHTENLQLY